MVEDTAPTQREEDIIEAIYRSPHRDQGVTEKSCRKKG